MNDNFYFNKIYILFRAVKGSKEREVHTQVESYFNLF